MRPSSAAPGFSTAPIRRNPAGTYSRPQLSAQDRPAGMEASGRIDRVIAVGALRARAAAAVASGLLPEDVGRPPISARRSLSPPLRKSAKSSRPRSGCACPSRGGIRPPARYRRDRAGARHRMIETASSWLTTPGRTGRLHGRLGPSTTAFRFQNPAPPRLPARLRFTPPPVRCPSPAIQSDNPPLSAHAPPH
jgi:hypothetical protein